MIYTILLKQMSKEKYYLLLGTTLLGTDTVKGPHPLIFPADALKKYRLPLVKPPANTLVPLAVPDAGTSWLPHTLEKSARDDHSTGIKI